MKCFLLSLMLFLPAAANAETIPAGSAGLTIRQAALMMNFEFKEVDFVLQGIRANAVAVSERDTREAVIGRMLQGTAIVHCLRPVIAGWPGYWLLHLALRNKDQAKICGSPSPPLTIPAGEAANNLTKAAEKLKFGIVLISGDLSDLNTNAVTVSDGEIMDDVVRRMLVGTGIAYCFSNTRGAGFPVLKLGREGRDDAQVCDWKASTEAYQPIDSPMFDVPLPSKSH
jgi:hypothetical protein